MICEFCWLLRFDCQKLRVFDMLLGTDAPSSIVLDLHYSQLMLFRKFLQLIDLNARHGWISDGAVGWECGAHDATDTKEVAHLMKEEIEVAYKFGGTNGYNDIKETGWKWWEGRLRI